MVGFDWGITPAYAGKSTHTHGISFIPRDHPRLRGEKSKNTLYRAVKKGSPPLTRGKVWAINFIPICPRITPAYAGKSRSASSRYKRRRDHPRLRGEKLLLYRSLGTPIGSPPLTRGKDSFDVSSVMAKGITPAYAGKRIHASSIPPEPKDHPRLRGEKLFHVVA